MPCTRRIVLTAFWTLKGRRKRRQGEEHRNGGGGDGGGLHR